MQTLDLKKIIETYSLDTREVAEELFPKNKYPKLALDRVLKGESFLDTTQLSLLSQMTGVPIQFLFSNGAWKVTSPNKGTVVFESEGYRAELDLDKWITKVYHKETLFHEQLLHKGAIPLSDYLEQINLLITKNKEKWIKQKSSYRSM